MDMDTAQYLANEVKDLLDFFTFWASGWFLAAWATAWLMFIGSHKKG